MSKRKPADWYTSEQVKDGEPFIPSSFEECCDCGLVHRVKYEVLGPNKKVLKDVTVRCTVWRHESATKHARKIRKPKG